MRKTGWALMCAAALLLSGCGQRQETPYDYDLAEYVQVGEYSGISYLPYGDTGRTTVEPEDTVTAELSASVEGVEEPFGGTYTFEVGYSNFLDGFDAALVGMELNAPKTVELTFPDDYEEAPEYAGRAVEVQVRVTDIDFTAYRTVNEDALWQIAQDESTVLRYPQTELEAYEADFRACYEGFAREYGMELEDYLQKFFGAGEAELTELCRANAETSVKRDLVMYAILRGEGLTVTDQQLDACKPQWLETYGYASEADMPKSWKDPEVGASLRAMAAEQTVKAWIYDHALPQKPG